MKAFIRHTLEVGSFEVNCSIVTNGEVTYVIDPGGEAGAIAATLESMQLVPTAILLTHAHFDHIGAIPELQRRYPALPVYVHAGDRSVLVHPLNQLPPDYPPVAEPANLRDPQAIAGVEVIETPGHTPGGVCYYFRREKLLFSGDTLFAGSVGRTDLPGGDFAVLYRSLAKLRPLPQDTIVIPGHGPTTTIGEEIANNQFLRNL